MEILEIGIIIIIIGFQVIVYLANLTKINRLEGLFPQKKGLSLLRISFKKNTVSVLNEEALHANLNTAVFDDHVLDPDDNEVDEYLAVRRNTNVIKPKENFSSAFAVMLRSTNLYLLKNHENAIDFKIIKDIAERKTEALINQIEATLQLPLYLGLLGTILGIIVGLGNIIVSPDEMDLALNLEEGIPSLLSGVIFAMSAGFIGLLFTILGVGIHFRKGLQKCDDLKHDYYSFIQAELLSNVRDFSTNLREMQDDLVQLNTRFSSDMTKTIGEFTNSVKNIETDVLEKQTKLLESINNISFNNIESVFREINKSGQTLKANLNVQAASIKQLYSAVEELKTGEKDIRDLKNNILSQMQENYLLLNQRASKEIDEMKKKYNELNPEFKQLKRLEHLTKIEGGVESIFLSANQLLENHKTDQQKTQDYNQQLLTAILQMNKNIEQLISINTKKRNGRKGKNGGIWTNVKSYFAKDNTNNNQGRIYNGR